METVDPGQRRSAGPDAGSTSVRAELEELLLRVRERTRLLMQPLSNEDALMQHDPLMSPIAWDLGHIAAFEQLWLRDQLDSLAQFGEMPGLYNPFEHPRAKRGALPLPSLSDALAELDSIRAETLERLEQVDFDGSPLLAQGFVYRMVAQHESQHQETMLQTLQLKRGEPYRPPRAWELPTPQSGERPSGGTMARFPGGTVTIGSDDGATTYDNERPAHLLELAPFEIDMLPVTNGDYLEFMRDGGYDDERLWSGSGIEWLHETGARSPAYWSGTHDFWTERVMNVERTLDSSRPVCHVCFHEAQAYARWVGKRLPTETEWEVAATWNPASRRNAFPWGDGAADRTRANVDQLAFDRAPVRAYDANVSPLGCYGLIGDVWEWTSSDFTAYPGFVSFPYREYSEPFFGSQYKVLRGGSWATALHVARATFRNWDFPVRRQIFSGFRCARDA